MKSVIALSTLGLAAVLSFSVACDNEGSAVSCTADADCANETDNTTCDVDVGVCVAPSEPVCENGTDCDLEDTGTGSPIADPADFANGCEAEDFVTIVAFDGNEYCALEAGDTGCEAGQAEATATLKAGGTADVCVVADGECSEDGQCS